MTEPIDLMAALEASLAKAREDQKKTAEQNVEYLLPDGTWRCTRDQRTTPCGDCDGCRQVASLNRTRTRRRFSCEACGCDVSKSVSLGGSTYWVDTRGCSLCPSWTQRFHAPNPVALSVPDQDGPA